jgi:hypothetical protein
MYRSVMICHISIKSKSFKTMFTMLFLRVTPSGANFVRINSCAVLSNCPSATICTAALTSQKLFQKQLQTGSRQSRLHKYWKIMDVRA